MMATERALFPAYSIDAELVKQTFTNVEASINSRNNEQILGHTSQAYAQVHKLLTTILEIRAHVLLSGGKFDEAIKEAESIITYQPTLATGYLRLGEIQRMRGKQQNAIDAYDLGLQSVSEDDTKYAHMIYGKELATARSEKKVDFIASLPTEMVDIIFGYLPNKSTLKWIPVSKAWRAKILSSSAHWRTWSTKISTNIDWSKDVLEDIAPHVEDLTINTSVKQVFLRYLHVMNDGKFVKIKALKMDEVATTHFSSTIVPLLSSAFWNIHDTLTKLIVEFTQFGAILTLEDLISFCPNLEYLEYSTPYTLLHGTDDIQSLFPHNNLIDLRLKAHAIIEQDLQKLMPGCQKVRSLTLIGCNPTVLDFISRSCQNLEIFGYNAPFNIIPELDGEATPGLRKIYTNNGGEAVPASAILPLLRENQLTLQTVFANISGENQPRELIGAYANLELRKLKTLTYWGDDLEVVQPLLLRSISTCTTLTYLSIVETRSIREVVNALMELPQLVHLAISYPWCTGGAMDLVRLFKKYAIDPPERQHFKSISLRYCRNSVTDNVLFSLSNIPTLENITLEGLPYISTQGVNEFFRKLGSRITDLKLKEIDAVTSGSLIVAGKNMNCLKSIRLENLRNVSGYGLLEMIGHAQQLQNLTLVKPGSTVNQKSIGLLRKKVENLVIIN